MLRDVRRHRAAATAAPTAGSQPGSGPGPRWQALPFDYATTLKLKGQPGRIEQGVITIGPDAAFVATAIGYAFAEELDRPIESEAITAPAGTTPTTFIPRDITLAQLPPRALIDGFRVSPRALSLVFEVDPDIRDVEEIEWLRFRADQYSWSRRGEVFQRLTRPEEIAFLLSVVDSATGRELSDEPIHNLAALGSSDGRRPFRPLAKPMAFLPRSTIRFQLTERQADRTGPLDIVLFGYKVPAAAAASEETVRQVLANEPPLVEQYQGRRVIPFDYVAQIPLRGIARTTREVELAINVEGAFAATAISYALDTSEEPVLINLNAIRGMPSLINTTNSTFPLDQVTLERIPPDALLDGVRLRPRYARLAFEGGGRLSNAVRADVANDLFERLNLAESVRFRYRLHDAGAGRDLQNQFIYSVAGLGSATGERPFKRFARPLSFEPRSTLRFTVEEISGRGMLHLVLQGYKRLDGGGPT
jgi:hypothetical protein